MLVILIVLGGWSGYAAPDPTLIDAALCTWMRVGSTPRANITPRHPPRVQQPAFDRAHGGLRAIGYAQLGDNMLDMDLDRANAERELLRDLAIGVPLDNLLEHFTLARRQPLRRQADRLAIACSRQALERARRDLAAQHRFAAQHPPNGAAADPAG